MLKTRTAHGVSLVTSHDEILPDVLRRLSMLLLFISFIILVLWLDRAGLEDTTHPDRPLTLLDVAYYAVISLTTVGYGDIVPVTPRARLIATFIVTPVRIFVLLIFIDAAYQLVVQRYREAYQMRRIQSRLAGHVIICGYGVKGRATVAELLSYGHNPKDIVTIDICPVAAEDASRQGLVTFRGDATAEASLKAAGIDRAQYVIVDVDRDDTALLICLTAKHLNPDVSVVAAAKEAENVPLIYRSGANVVVAPPVAGGRMLAIATRFSYAPRFLDDILSFGSGLDLGERTVEPAEAGKTVDELPDLSSKLLIGAYHRGQRYTFDQLPNLHLNAGDVVIFLTIRRY